MNEDRAAHQDHAEAPLTAAVDRLRAARSARDDETATPAPAADLPGPTGATEDTGTGDVPVRDAPALDDTAAHLTLASSDVLADELRRRLADRRGATAGAKHAAAAYAALHGHVPGAADDELDQVGRPRWALRSRTALVAVGAVLVLATAGAVITLRPRVGVEDLADAPSVAASQAPPADENAAGPGVGSRSGEIGSGAEPGAAPTPSELLVVDVVGQVNQPGVVTLPDGSRVFDAVAAAGGAAAHAELSGLNMARLVVDGEQIRVPAPGETVPVPATAPGPATGGDGGLVDLNSADEVQLDTLPGIGPALAARIITWRADNGPFASVDELDEVSGIGPAMLARLRDLVTV